MTRGLPVTPLVNTQAQPQKCKSRSCFIHYIFYVLYLFLLNQTIAEARDDSKKITCLSARYATGQTTFIHRYVGGNMGRFQATCNLDLEKKELQYESQSVTLHIWDVNNNVAQPPVVNNVIRHSDLLISLLLF